MSQGAWELGAGPEKLPVGEEDGEGGEAKVFPGRSPKGSIRPGKLDCKERVKLEGAVGNEHTA